MAMMRVLNGNPKYIPGYWTTEAIAFATDAYVFLPLLEAHEPEVPRALGFRDPPGPPTGPACAPRRIVWAPAACAMRYGRRVFRGRAHRGASDAPALLPPPPPRPAWHISASATGGIITGGGGGVGVGGWPRCYQVPGQPLLNRHQVGDVSRSPDGLFAQQERDPIRGRPAVRGKRTYGGRPGQRVEEQGTWASRTQKHSEAGYGRPVDRGGQQKQSNDPGNNQHNPQYANYWAPLTRKRHIPPHSAQPPAHQLLGSANAETTPAGAPAAAADRTQRPNTRCEGKNG